MPRGDNPNSRANLIVNSERTPKERKVQASKAGKTSGESRRLKKSFKEAAKAQCTPEVLDKITGRIIQMAMAGNLNAFKILRELLGEDPKDEIQKELLKLRKREVELKEEGW